MLEYKGKTTLSVILYTLKSNLTIFSQRCFSKYFLLEAKAILKFVSNPNIYLNF